MPLFQLPQLISQLVNAQVALNRLSEFLAAEEQGPMPTLPAVQQGEQLKEASPSMHMALPGSQNASAEGEQQG